MPPKEVRGYQTRSSRPTDNPESEEEPVKDHESDEEEEAGPAPEDTDQPPTPEQLVEIIGALALSTKAVHTNLTQLTNVVETSVTAEKDSTRQKTVKVSTPDTFHGEREKLKPFLAQVELYMQFNSGLFSDEENKVLFAASYLRGTAFNWFQPFQTTYLSEDPPQDSEAHKLLTSYTEFKKRLTEVFGMVNEKQDAERKILLLQQKGAASTYTTEFAQLNSILGWPNDTLIAQFYKGLKDHVKDELVKIE